MKVYIKSAKELPEGTKVIIKTGDLKGEWGVVKMFDGEYYHVAPWNDSKQALIFERSELKVMK